MGLALNWFQNVVQEQSIAAIFIAIAMSIVVYVSLLMMQSTTRVEIMMFIQSIRAK